MMDDSETEIVEQAIAWQRAIADGEVDWTAFTAWLEGDPAHRDAYDDVALIDAAIATHRDRLSAVMAQQSAGAGTRANVHAPARARRWVVGTGVAAALAVAVALPLLQSRPAQSIAYSTPSGETRSVAFENGSRLELSADTAISVERERHHMTMAHGAAYFDVRHDPARQLVIDAGGYRVSDIGTRFSIDLAGDRVSIAVAQGAVTVMPPTGGGIRVSAGEALTGGLNAPPTKASIAPDAVASWRGGRLTYDDATFNRVASDISRYTGERIDIDAAARNRRFSGVLVIGDGSHLVSDFAAVAGLAVRRGADRTVLASDGR